MLELHLPYREIGHTVVCRCGLHSAGDVLPTSITFQSRILICGCDQFCQMASRDPSGINAVLGCIGAQETYGALAILNVGWKRRVAAETVEEARGHEPFGSEQLRAGIAVLVTALPTPAVDPQHRWRRRPVAVLRDENVHQQRLASPGAVLNVGNHRKLRFGRLCCQRKHEEDQANETKPHIRGFLDAAQNCSSGLREEPTDSAAIFPELGIMLQLSAQEPIYSLELAGSTGGSCLTS